MEVVDRIAPPPPPPLPPTPCNKDLSAVAKGKRTKRHRPHSPPNIPFTIITPPAGEYHTTTTTFSATSSSEESTTTEEEDTARCLILLARGHNFSIHVSNDHDIKQINTSKIRHAETTAAASGGGACMYTCKTCDRVFSSFQALGGHRASHKKPKNDKRSPFFSNHEEDFQPPKKLKMLEFGNISTTGGGVAARTHECGYCGAEFPSGQALGGHMRRHRADPEAKKPPTNNALSLDLNLPAPEDENQRLGLAGRQHKSSEKLVLLTALIN